jgi:hypothetical protein
VARRIEVSSKLPGSETFVDLYGPTRLLATAPLLLGAFALWGEPARACSWKTGR